MPSAPSSVSPLHQQNSFNTFSYRRNWCGGIAENRYTSFFTMPECSCRGINPDCFRCGGWGWIGDQTAERRGGKPALPQIRTPAGKTLRAKRRKKPRQTCPYCSGAFSDVQLHVSKEHAEKWDQYLSDPSNAKALRLRSGKLRKRCHLCGHLTSKIDRHYKTKHPRYRP